MVQKYGNMFIWITIVSEWEYVCLLWCLPTKLIAPTYQLAGEMTFNGQLNLTLPHKLHLYVALWTNSHRQRLLLLPHSEDQISWITFFFLWILSVSHSQGDYLKMALYSCLPYPLLLIIHDQPTSPHLTLISAVDKTALNKLRNNDLYTLNVRTTQNQLSSFIMPGGRCRYWTGTPLWDLRLHLCTSEDAGWQKYIITNQNSVTCKLSNPSHPYTHAFIILHISSNCTQSMSPLEQTAAEL